jgi:TatA/E family protein of Tat protein translocase
MWGLSVSHWILVVGVIVLLFGASRIPAMMEDMGKTIKEIRKIPSTLEEDLHDDGKEPTQRS